jgi:predicted dehydrogenase
MTIEAVVVVGLGNIANRHRKNIRQLYPSAKVTAVSASGRIPGEPIMFSDSVVAHLEDVDDEIFDLAIVASPSSLHAQHSIQLIAKGIPTIIEKPIASNLDDATSILASIEKYGTRVAIGYCLRFLPSIAILREILSRGGIGEILSINLEAGQYLPDWRPRKDFEKCVSANKALGGGALLELSHELDYFNWLFGDLKVEYARLRSSNELNLDVEDTVDIYGFSSINDASVSIHLDFIQRQPRRKCSVVGSFGAMDLDLIKNELSLSVDGKEEIVFSDPNWDKNNMYIDFLREFTDGNGDDQKLTSAEEAMIVVRLIELIKSKFITTNY